nr:immunoglobulin light chain junction region [Macaca mulatta]MOW57732.1 immunoglobulin light chain junction region [Macaca mulatta]MOW66508.1 immunoglobulin light chain junction region [Macaca mulatta]
DYYCSSYAGSNTYYIF